MDVFHQEIRQILLANDRKTQTKLDQIQKSIDNLRSEMREKAAAIDFDVGEPIVHEKVTSLEQFKEMENKLLAAGSSELIKQLVSL